MSALHQARMRDVCWRWGRENGADASDVVERDEKVLLAGLEGKMVVAVSGDGLGRWHGGNGTMARW